MSATATVRFPRQIKFIIGNEACERFSFYGMRSILTVFLIQYLLLNEAADSRAPMAKEVFHLFVMGVYFFPLLGGYLADRFIGKYHTILWLSVVYIAGHALLAFFDDSRAGFYTGLVLIALGSGGIKPCVAAFVGDQFTESNKQLTKVVFAIFYWSVNLGSFFASLFIPKTLKLYGPAVAFGIPGVLMAIATLLFWLGRSQYTELPPTGRNPHSFLKVVFSALRNRGQAGQGSWLEAAAPAHPPEAIIAARAVFRALLVFAPVPFFWMLFDQKASTWVMQAMSMDLEVGPWNFEPAQLQFINPAMVMLLIPFTQVVVFPAFARLGLPLTPLRRMTVGMFFAATSFVLVALIQVALDGGSKLSVLWQIAPYVFLTLGEVLIAVTGLEFAYSQAPIEMKATIMAFWNLAISAGNLAVVLVTKLNVFHGVASLLFYASITGLAGIAMGLIARGYVPMDFFKKDQAPPTTGEHSTAKPRTA